MRAIRQSDIEIAKAEVAILRSLGMEPDREALLLAQLERPPAVEIVAQEPLVELNGQPVEVESVPAEMPLVHGVVDPVARNSPADQDDEIDVALVLPASEEATVVRIRMDNVHGGARDVVGMVELAKVDEHFVYSKGVRLGKHARVEPERGIPVVEGLGGVDAKVGPTDVEAAKSTMPEKFADLVATAAPALSHAFFRLGRSAD